MWILWVTCALLAAVGFTAAGIMRNYLKAFRRYDEQAFVNSLHGDMAQYTPVICRMIEDNKQIFTEPLVLHTEDGETLSADLYRAEGTPKGTILLVHGFRGSARGDFSCAIPLYHGLGWNLVLADQRAQGRSSGRRMGLGVLERYDVAAWAWQIAGQMPEQPIFLGGISMGATSVMMACGLPLPEEVRGVIADCGFTTPYDIFRWLLRREGMPSFLLPLFQLLARPVLGYGLRDCSTLDTLAHSGLPLLLFHGEADRFVPCDMSRQNYAAAAAEDKTLITVPGATHGMSYLVQPERCHTALTSFLERNGGPA